VLNLKLFSIRTFLVAALGNVWGRLGLSSVPFLLPLLFQIGYDLSPLHSGLLTFVGTIGMITMKFMNKAILHRFGFKKALSAFSLMAGMTISSFALISEINVPLIIVLVFLNGLVSSLLYTAMNVLYYVDLSPADMSNATSISSMLQQMSMGFGITLSGVVLRIFVGWNNKLVLGNPIPFRLAFIVMGAISFLSVLVFLKLKSNDGQEASGSYS
jgi:hypothetical protein